MYASKWTNKLNKIALAAKHQAALTPRDDPLFHYFKALGQEAERWLGV